MKTIIAAVLALATTASAATLPDWSGTWSRAEGFQHPDPRALLPYLTADEAAAFKKQIDANSFRVPWSSCDPAAFPAMMTEVPLGFEWYFAPGRITMVMADDAVRRIFTDGAAHYSAKTGETSYFGDSTAHWEGDTLVIDTIGLNPDNQVVIGFDNNDNLHVVERIRKTDPNTLQDQLTITGFEGEAKPFVRTQLYKRSTQPAREQLCIASKNRDTGTSLDLTPPK